MKELGWTVIACPVCRGVKRAEVFESHEPGVLMGLLLTRGRAIMVQRCRGCAVEMIHEPSGQVHTDESLTAADMLEIEDPDEADLIVATADLFGRMAEGDIDEEERSGAIAILCDALVREAWVMGIRSTRGPLYCLSFVAVATLILSLAPHNTGRPITTLLILLLFVTAVVSWVGFFWMLSELRYAKEQKRLPDVLRPLKPSLTEIRRSVDHVHGDRMGRWIRSMHARFLYSGVKSKSSRTAAT